MPPQDSQIAKRKKILAGNPEGRNRGLKSVHYDTSGNILSGRHAYTGERLQFDPPPIKPRDEAIVAYKKRQRANLGPYASGIPSDLSAVPDGDRRFFENPSKHWGSPNVSMDAKMAWAQQQEDSKREKRGVMANQARDFQKNAQLSQARMAVNQANRSPAGGELVRAARKEAEASPTGMAGTQTPYGFVGIQRNAGPVQTASRPASSPVSNFPGAPKPVDFSTPSPALTGAFAGAPRVATTAPTAPTAPVSPASRPSNRLSAGDEVAQQMFGGLNRPFLPRAWRGIVDTLSKVGEAQSAQGRLQYATTKSVVDTVKRVRKTPLINAPYSGRTRRRSNGVTGPSSTEYTGVL